MPNLRVRQSNGAPAADEVKTVSASLVTGFGPMPRISTNFGEVHAQVIRKGDMVRELMGNYTPVQVVDQIRLDSDFLSRHPGLQPVRIRRGAFGPGMPSQDILVAPAQRVRPGPVRANVQFVPAVQLVGRPYVDRAQESQVVFTRFSIGKPSVVMCEGLAMELTI